MPKVGVYSRTDELTEHLFRCECGSSHFISVVWVREKDSDDDPGYFSISSDDHCGGHWWNRLKAAWNIFFHRKHTWIEVVMYPETADQIITALSDRP